VEGDPFPGHRERPAPNIQPDGVDSSDAGGSAPDELLSWSPGFSRSGDRLKAGLQQVLGDPPMAVSLGVSAAAHPRTA
jgi:hypothetical protein